MLVTFQWFPLFPLLFKVIAAESEMRLYSADVFRLHPDGTSVAAGRAPFSGNMGHLKETAEVKSQRPCGPAWQLHLWEAQATCGPRAEGRFTQEELG